MLNELEYLKTIYVFFYSCDIQIICFECRWIVRQIGCLY